MAEAPTVYCDDEDIKSIFGAVNVQQWADIDNDGDAVKITARIDAAIAWAMSEIDDKLRGGRYTIPFDYSAVPSCIMDATATLAGVRLYESRGVKDFDPESGRPVHRLEWHRKRAYNQIREVQAGLRTLDAEQANGTADDPLPAIVNHTDELET